MSLEFWTLDDSPSNDWTSGELGDLTYRDINDGSGEESLSMDASEAQMCYITDWSRRQDFLDSVLGWASLSGTSIKRVLPEPHPDYNKFYASSATVKKMGKPSVDAGVSVWTKAIITVSYKPTTYAVQSDEAISSELDRFVITEYDSTIDYLSIPGQMKFVPSGVVLDTTPGKIIQSTQITYTWLKVPSKYPRWWEPPTANRCRDLGGKINSAIFDGKAIGTVLFTKPQYKQQTPQLGDEFNYYWVLQYVMLHRDNGDVGGGIRAGHNYIFNQKAGQFQLVTSDGTPTGNPIYPSGDLNDLFLIDT